MRHSGASRRISGMVSGEDASAAQVVVVAIDAGDDGVFESELGDGFGDAARLVQVDRLGRPLGTAQKPQRRVQTSRAA